MFKDGAVWCFLIQTFKSLKKYGFPISHWIWKRKNHVLSKDPLLKKAVEFAPGLRLLRQDFHETLISFILSSNNNIQRIKKIIYNLCQTAGKDIECKGKIYKTFPTIKEMQHLTCEDFMKIGAGYRSKYLFIPSGTILNDVDIERLHAVLSSEREKISNAIWVSESKWRIAFYLIQAQEYDSFPADVLDQEDHGLYISENLPPQSKF